MTRRYAETLTMLDHASSLARLLTEGKQDDKSYSLLGPMAMGAIACTERPNYTGCSPLH